MMSTQFTRFLHLSSTRIAMGANKSNLAKLRKKTGYPFGNCKKALEANNNDLDQVKYQIVGPVFTRKSYFSVYKNQAKVPSLIIDLELSYTFRSKLLRWYNLKYICTQFGYKIVFVYT